MRFAGLCNRVIHKEISQHDDVHSPLVYIPSTMIQRCTPILIWIIGPVDDDDDDDMMSYACAPHGRGQ